MNLMLKRVLCQFLVLAMAMLPFQSGQASMIGADQLTHSATSQLDRSTVSNFLERAEVAGQMQSLGLDAQTAKNRVASMTDAEVGTLAGKINALPAGGDLGGLLVLILLIWAVWHFVLGR